MQPESKSEPRVAVIGAGYWGKNLIRNFHALGCLTTICESNPATLARFQEDYPQVKKVAATNQVFEDPDTDAVAVSSPAESHYGLVKQALGAGKHVFVEKPLSLKVEEGEELVGLAKEQGLLLMVGHLLHYHPAVVKLKELINQGALGKIQYIYSNRLNLGKIRTEENILWSFAPHDISLLLSLTGQMPHKVSAQGSYFLNLQIADVTVSNFSFPSGVSAHIFVSWLHPFKEQKLVVVGDRSMAVFDDTEPDDKLIFYPHQVVWKGGLPVPDKKDAVKVDWDRTEPLKNQCRHFLDCIGNGGQPLTDGEEGLRVLTVLDACQRSMRQSGRMIQMQEDQPVHPGYQAHPTAVIDDGAQVGQDTKIWHFSHVMDGARIGKGCNIGQNVVISPGAVIGDGCKIQNNVSVYKGVELDDHVFCGPSMVFTNVKNPRSEIGRMDQVKTTRVKQGASIGGNATIVCGNTLGRYCFIGAGAVVTRDVPDFALMLGNPARRTAWICRCGEQLPDTKQGKTACQVCGRSYLEHEGALQEGPKA